VRGAFLAVVVSTGCSNQDPATEPAVSTDAAARDAASPADAQTEARELSPSRIPADFHCDPTLDSIEAGIFTTSCALEYCHGRTPAWGLNLAADTQTVYDRLVNVRALSCEGWTRVTPGDPEHSLLWNKVSQEKPACGERMPFGFEPLPDAALECIRGWIAQL
jgi:hypothetical protein